MPLALSDELAQNTAALARVLASLLSLGEKQRRAASEVNEARLQAIFDEREKLLKTLEELLLSRQQWRDAVQRLPDATADKADLLASLASDDATLFEKGQQVQHIAHEAETALRSTVQDIGAQLKTQRQRENVMRAYHPPSQPPPRFVDRVNVS